MVMKFIGINHSSTMIAKEMRNAISFRFRFMSTASHWAHKEFTLLLIGLRMSIKNMVAKIGFTFIFLRAMRAKEWSFVCFHMVVHSALKPFRFVTDRTDKMTSFILKIFIHCDAYSWSLKNRDSILFSQFWNIKRHL
jgi:hypothetical protein